MRSRLRPPIFQRNRHHEVKWCRADSGIRNAKDLSPDQKTAIESLLGRRLLEDETVSVRTIEPPPLSEQRRHELAAELRKFFAEVDYRRQPGSAEEAEQLLDEALRSTRPGYRPHQ